MFVQGETHGDFEFLKVRREGDVALVSMDRPPVNAVSQSMYLEIRELFSSAREHLSGAAVVILAGEGKHFCAGNDLDEFLTLTSVNSPGRMKLVREAFAAIYDCPMPVIAAVHGFAVGTGLAIAASSDLVICSESARFGVPEVSVGVMGGAKHLSRVVPQQVLRLMYFTAEPVTGHELHLHGGVVGVVEDDELLEAAMALAHRITKHSAAALRVAKESLNTIEYMDLKSGYEFEQRLTGQLASHADSIEARQAIRQKRQPRFQPPE